MTEKETRVVDERFIGIVSGKAMLKLAMAKIQKIQNISDEKRFTQMKRIARLIDKISEEEEVWRQFLKSNKHDGAWLIQCLNTLTSVSNQK